MCLFHTLRSFETIEKMGIRSGQRDGLLALFNEIATSRWEQQFEDQVSLLEDMNIRAASLHFRRSWSPIKCEWVRCFKTRHFTLGEETSNRLESFNSKIKSVRKKYSSLDYFFSDLFIVCYVCCGESEIMQRPSELQRTWRAWQKTIDITCLTSPHSICISARFSARKKRLESSCQTKNDQSCHQKRPESSCQTSVRTKYSSLDSFFSDLFSVLRVLRGERDHAKTIRTTKNLACMTGDDRHYMSHLTPARLSGRKKRLESVASYQMHLHCTPSTVSLRRSQTHTPAALTSHQKHRQLIAIASHVAGLASDISQVEFLERLDLLELLRTE